MTRCNRGPLDGWNALLARGLQVAVSGGWLSLETWVGALQVDADKIDALADDLWNVKNLQMYVRGPLCRGQWQQVCILTQEIFAARAILQAWIVFARSKCDILE
jgi:hypothetical protein